MSNDSPDLLEHPPVRREPSRLNWRQVGILYRRELRAALRERTIVLNSILIPIFLYPFLMWAAFTGLMFVAGQTEGYKARVAVLGWPREHPALRKAFERNERFELAAPELAGSASAAQQKVRSGELDALLEFLPATNAALAGNFQTRLTYNGAKDRSEAAKERVAGALDKYRENWLKRDARERGIDAASWQGFTLSWQNLASKKQMGVFILGLIAPIIFVVMVAIGCFYPAVDALAGERERNTWETLMSTAASRGSVVTAKYLYVASMGGLAGILNLAAVALTAKPIFGPLFAKADRALEFSFPLAAIPVALTAAVLLAGFIAAGMMLFAAFARTFKEGQSMITPFYMLILVPIVFLQVPGLHFTLPLAFLPVVNLTLMVREAVSGVFHWPQIGIAVAVSLGLIAGCVRLAAFILQFEDVVMGSYSGSLHKFLQERAFPARQRAKTHEQER